MAPPQANRNNQEVGRQRSAPKDEDARPQERTVSQDTSTESPTSNTPGKNIQDRKRKRPQEDEPTLSATTSQKRPRTSLPLSPIKDTIGENTAVGDSGEEIDPLEYWTRELRWPQEHFEPESNMSSMGPPLTRRNSSYLRGKPSGTGSTTPTMNTAPVTPSDQKPREFKAIPYLKAEYKRDLERKGSFMRNSELGIADTSKTLCRTLLEAEQTVPEDSLFQDDRFDQTCEMIRDMNEAKVIQDIARLIVPSPMSLAIRGAKHLEPLIESVNDGWNYSIALTKPRPQSDFAVGFKETAFTEDQQKKLRPFTGGFMDTSYYMSTHYMYFPFLTCEVKCGAGDLEVADRQNAHSMTLAVRGIIELFKLVGRQKELHRQILAFSISHDATNVRIYGHYPVVDGDKITFYRHEIDNFSFTRKEGKDKWTAYKFTKNVYDIWMPTHFQRICSVIDELPINLNFSVSQQSESGEYGYTQGLESDHFSGQSSHYAESLEEADSQSSRVGSRDGTSNTSLSAGLDRKAFEK